MTVHSADINDPVAAIQIIIGDQRSADIKAGQIAAGTDDEERRIRIPMYRVIARQIGQRRITDTQMTELIEAYSKDGVKVFQSGIFAEKTEAETQENDLTQEDDSNE